MPRQLPVLEGCLQSHLDGAATLFPSLQQRVPWPSGRACCLMRGEVEVHSKFSLKKFDPLGRMFSTNGYKTP